MSSRPRLKRALVAEILEGEGAYLLGERESYVLRGRAYLALLPLLDGQSTVEEICGRIEDSVPPAEALHALATLERQGFVTDAALAGPPAEAAYWEALGAPAGDVSARLRHARVTLLSVGGAPSSPLQEALAEMGIGVDPGGDLVVLAEDPLHPDLAAVNQARLADGRPWLLLRASGLEAWLGPFFVPGKTGCWRCLAQRIEGHRPVERYLARRTGRAVGPATRAALPATRRALAGMAATLIARWAVTGTIPSLEGAVLTVDTATFETRRHVLTRRPQCAACGDPGMVARRQMEPVVLAPSAAAFTGDGGHRAASPEETFARLACHVSPVTGIVRSLVRMPIPGGDDLVLSYVTEHDTGEAAESLPFLRTLLGNRSGGKGRTEIQAKTSAVCESIERYSGVYRGDEARVRATLADLGGDGIHPNLHLGYSARQYAERDAWNRREAFFCAVPRPFDPAWAVDWSPVWSLTEQRRRYLPTASCYYGCPTGGAPVFAYADSSGCAAGNTLAEAFLQGFLELVERDAVAIWWYNRLRLPGVDLGRSGEPYTAAVAERWRRLGRELWALDLTSDLGIPTFAAISRRTRRDGGAPQTPARGPGEAVMFGFGAHFDARVALLRAITEHNQVTPLLDLDPSRAPLGEVVHDWLRRARVETEPYLLPAEGAPARALEGDPPHRGGDLRDDAERCVAIARDKGLETLVLDQTRPDTGLVTVKVFVPGLRHFWARLGPGRLYDVPVQRGLAPAPLPEEAMNPWPMFL